MIYAEPERARGRSFKGLLGYILHDPGKQSAERLLFANTVNLVMGVDDAAREMTATYRRALDARRAGQRPDKPAFHFILSWHPEDRPTPPAMLGATVEALKALVLSEHEAVIAGHGDTGNSHVHVAVNVIHPETGKAAPLRWRRKVMSAWCAAYEQSQGVIRCAKRLAPKAANENRKRATRQAWAERTAKQQPRANRTKQKPDMQPGLRP